MVDIPRRSNIKFAERKYRRFNLSYPVRLMFQSGGSGSQVDAISRNICIGGLLLETASWVPEDSDVSFVLTIEGPKQVQPIELVGQGNVVRVEKTPEAVMVAVECKNPIAQLENYFPQIPQ
jgi:hypothetical protein